MADCSEHIGGRSDDDGRPENSGGKVMDALGWQWLAGGP